MSSRKVCVIGAGPSGITALKNLLDEGIEAIAFDRQHDVGGNWIYSEEEGHSSVFETTHIISSKTLSQYADFTFDDFDPSVADYPSHDELRRYFQAYARQFDLYPHIRFGVLVKHCERVGDTHWQVTIEENGEEKTEEFTDLVVCNGHHWLPRYPEYPGTFSGEFLHSHQFKKAAPFAGKRVLVIGGGNSACDVAVETSRVSEHTAISWRRGYRITPKFAMGLPTDILGARLAWMPLWIRNRTSEFLIRLLVGKNEQYGLQPATDPFGATHPTLNSELLYKIRHGKVKPHVDIERLDGNTVHFKDGSQAEFDVIIACTGYILAHPFFDSKLIDYRSGPVPLYLRMFHPEYRNLYFVGMFQPLGCIWPGAELQAKLMARELVGKWKRPKNIAALCQREVTHPHFRQVDSPRHTITVDYHKFVRELKRELPKDWVRKSTLKQESQIISTVD
ncbi:MAG: NAD(P)-binding domain-containing protein [Bacteroidota bacterium]